MLVHLVLALVIGLTLGFIIKRLRDLNALSIWVWPLMVVSAIAPSYVAFNVLNPGQPVATAEVRAEKDAVQLTIPPNHSIMVTAVLTEESEEPGTDKTAYNLHIQGKGWEESGAGTMKRESAKGGTQIDAMGDQGIQETGGTRRGKIGEDLQDRFDLDRDGDVTVTVTNWQGTAAERLILEVVPSPPSDVVMWAFATVVILFSLVLEVKSNAERLASDLSFLALWAVFLRDGVTPLDDVQGVAFALMPAALISWLGVAGLEYLVVNFMQNRGNPKDAPEPEAPAEASEPEKTVPRRGAAARRRAAQQGEDSP